MYCVLYITNLNSDQVSTWGGLCSFSAGSLTTLPLATPLSILLVNTRVERQTKQLVWNTANVISIRMTCSVRLLKYGPGTRVSPEL